MKEYFFIYNTKQATYFLESGLRALEVGLNCGRVYVKFLRDERAEEVFNDWKVGKKIEYIETP